MKDILSDTDILVDMEKSKPTTIDSDSFYDANVGIGIPFSHSFSLILIITRCFLLCGTIWLRTSVWPSSQRAVHMTNRIYP